MHLLKAPANRAPDVVEEDNSLAMERTGGLASSYFTNVSGDDCANAHCGNGRRNSALPAAEARMT